MSDTASEKLLLDYYARTAAQYDHVHLERSEHNLALRLISGLVYELGLRSILDTAAGTGRGYLYLKAKHPKLEIRANDLSEPLLRQAIEHGVPSSDVEVASTYCLPYRDGAFDMAIELGALHHMARPDIAIGEMLRVSRAGIALHDSNMYMSGAGAGNLLGNNLLGAALKMILCRTGIWQRLKRSINGRDYSFCEGDGVFYTYSVFQSMPILEEHCQRILVIPINGTRHKNTLPLLAASHCLIVALKAEFA